MHSIYARIWLSILFFLTPRIILASQAPEVIPAPNNDQGWCYYCSDDNAPPLCNTQCLAAMDKLCAQQLSFDQIVTNENCTLQYKPPVDPHMGVNGAPSVSATQDQCTAAFRGILASCGRDAGTNDTGQVDESYCTTSGGGGTYGWNDDGSVMTGTGRYIVTTNGTDQCGQAQASWHQATSVIRWDPSWVPENATVTINTDPAPVVGGAASGAAAAPVLNPECGTEVCDIFGQPYYATEPTPPWPEGGKNSLRHRIAFEGWSTDSGSTRLFNSIEDRCGVYPGNFQFYTNKTTVGTTQLIADFDLPTNLCFCVSDAIFDASVGIQLPNEASCPKNWNLRPGQNVNRIELRHLRERGLKVRDPRRIVKKDWSLGAEGVL